MFRAWLEPSTSRNEDNIWYFWARSPLMESMFLYKLENMIKCNKNMTKKCSIFFFPFDMFLSIYNSFSCLQGRMYAFIVGVARDVTIVEKKIEICCTTYIQVRRWRCHYRHPYKTAAGCLVTIARKNMLEKWVFFSL